MKIMVEVDFKELNRLVVKKGVSHAEISYKMTEDLLLACDRSLNGTSNPEDPLWLELLKKKTAPGESINNLVRKAVINK